MRADWFDVIAIEDWHVAGWFKNHQLARMIADRGAGEFGCQLEYKAGQRGKTVTVVDRWYPRCKTGSGGGYKIPKMPLKVRAWTYPQGQTPHDRDINPASNWQKVAESSVSGSSPGSA